MFFSVVLDTQIRSLKTIGLFGILKAIHSLMIIQKQYGHEEVKARITVERLCLRIFSQSPLPEIGFFVILFT